MKRTKQPEQTVWVQMITATGRWHDFTGFPFGPDGGRTMSEAVDAAKLHATPLSQQHPGKVRVVMKYIEVIEF